MRRAKWQSFIKKKKKKNQIKLHQQSGIHRLNTRSRDRHFIRFAKYKRECIHDHVCAAMCIRYIQHLHAASTPLNCVHTNRMKQVGERKKNLWTWPSRIHVHKWIWDVQTPPTKAKKNRKKYWNETNCVLRCTVCVVQRILRSSTYWISHTTGLLVKCIARHGNLCADGMCVSACCVWAMFIVCSWCSSCTCHRYVHTDTHHIIR